MSGYSPVSAALQAHGRQLSTIQIVVAMHGFLFSAAFSAINRYDSVPIRCLKHGLYAAILHNPAATYLQLQAWNAAILSYLTPPFSLTHN